MRSCRRFSLTSRVSSVETAPKLAHCLPIRVHPIPWDDVEFNSTCYRLTSMPSGTFSKEDCVRAHRLGIVQTGHCICG